MTDIEAKAKTESELIKSKLSDTGLEIYNFSDCIERPILLEDKVSRVFKSKVIKIAAMLSTNGSTVDPDDLMVIMNFETGGSFSPSQKNAAGSGATGLIQFMPQFSMEDTGFTTDELAKQDAVTQLDSVYNYFIKRRFGKRKYKNLDDLYLAVLYPAFIGRDSDAVMGTEGSAIYRQNSGLDVNKDGKITKGEICVSIRKSKQRAINNQ